MITTKLKIGDIFYRPDTIVYKSFDECIKDPYRVTRIQIRIKEDVSIETYYSDDSFSHLLATYSNGVLEEQRCFFADKEEARKGYIENCQKGIKYYEGRIIDGKKLADDSKTYVKELKRAILTASRKG